MRAFLARNAFPLSVAVVAAVVLGLFFVYPLPNTLDTLLLRDHTIKLDYQQTALHPTIDTTCEVGQHVRAEDVLS